MQTKREREREPGKKVTEGRREKKASELFPQLSLEESKP